MSVFHPQIYKDPFGGKHTVFLSKTFNIDRMPEAREEILEGNFQRVTLEDTTESVQVSRSFSYLHGSQNTLMLVFPQNRRHQWKEHSQQLKRTFDVLCKGRVLSQENPFLRVVYGLNELREKIVLQIHDIDDRKIELAKAGLLYEHSFLLNKNRINICLTDVLDEQLAFQVFFDHEPGHFLSLKPRRDFEEFSNNHSELISWSSAHSESIMNVEESEDYYVNAKRWSPRLPALTILEAIGRDLEAGSDINVTSNDFELVLKALPRGDHLPPWAKKILFALLKHLRSRETEAGMPQKIQAIFEIRFKKSLNGDWLDNNIQADVDTIWQLFESLPDSHIEGNSYLSEINLWRKNSKYDPTTFQIEIDEGVLTNQEKFEDVVRHEIGHSVHEKHKKKVDAWLRQRFGWQMFDPKVDEEMEQWMALLGGWQDIREEDKQVIKESIVQALGTSKWAAGPLPDRLIRSHPWYTAFFRPRLVFNASDPPGDKYWFQNSWKWKRYNGYAFAFNFYYKKLMAVSVSTIKLIKKIEKPYASMSSKEFFAELYELYYDLDDDRSAIPEDVKDWMDTNLT